MTDTSGRHHVTLKDIAQRCGVVKQIVSRALHNDPSVGKETAARIRAVAEELGYNASYNHAARRMALQKHGIELLNHVITYYTDSTPTPDPYVNEVLWGVWDTALSRRFGVLLAHPGLELPMTTERADSDGVTFFAVGNFETIYEPIRHLREKTMFGNRPIVTIFTPLPTCSSVVADDRVGGAMAAGHLLDLGHRRLLHFYPEKTTDQIATLRFAGYQDACRMRELDPDDVFVSASWYNEESETFITNTFNTLDAHPDITGILGRNDPSAVCIMRALQAKGMRVPDDYSVIGYDDTTPFYDAFGQNLLSTIHMPLLEIGRAAASLLIDRITGKEPNDRQIVFTPTLLTRASTARPGSGVCVEA